MAGTKYVHSFAVSLKKVEKPAVGKIEVEPITSHSLKDMIPQHNVQFLKGHL